MADQAYLNRVFGKVARSKAPQTSDYKPKLEIGRHRVLLSKYRAKQSKKPGQEDQTILESEFVVMTSTVHKEGDERGWPWFIDEAGWSGIYNQDNAKQFLKVAGQCIGDDRDTDQIGVDLAGPEQMGRGLMLDVIIKEQLNKKTGEVKRSPDGTAYTEIKWIPVAQTLEDIAKARAVLDEMQGVSAVAAAPVEEPPPPPPPPAPAPTPTPTVATGGFGGLLGSLKNRGQ